MISTGITLLLKWDPQMSSILLMVWSINSYLLYLLITVSNSYNYLGVLLVSHQKSQPIYSSYLSDYEFISCRVLYSVNFLDHYTRVQYHLTSLLSIQNQLFVGNQNPELREPCHYLGSKNQELMIIRCSMFKQCYYKFST